MGAVRSATREVRTSIARVAMRRCSFRLSRLENRRRSMPGGQCHEGEARRRDGIFVMCTSRQLPVVNAKTIPHAFSSIIATVSRKHFRHVSIDAYAPFRIAPTRSNAQHKGRDAVMLFSTHHACLHRSVVPSEASLPVALVALRDIPGELVAKCDKPITRNR